jgi:hypothetical protein
MPVALTPEPKKIQNEAELMSADDNKSTKAERDAAEKAVLDNMARLKALRLAREASMPQAAPKKKAAAKSSGRSATSKTSSSKPAEKSVALAAWLAEQRKGGFRT